MRFSIAATVSLLACSVIAAPAAETQLVKKADPINVKDVCLVAVTALLGDQVKPGPAQDAVVNVCATVLEGLGAAAGEILAPKPATKLVKKADPINVKDVCLVAVQALLGDQVKPGAEQNAVVNVCATVLEGLGGAVAPKSG